jgi:hypothetical protein
VAARWRPSPPAAGAAVAAVQRRTGGRLGGGGVGQGVAGRTGLSELGYDAGALV